MHRDSVYNMRCVKSAHIRSYSGPHFLEFGQNMRDTEYVSAFSPTTGKCGREYGRFLRSACCTLNHDAFNEELRAY